MSQLTIEEQEVVRTAQREQALEKLEAEILKGINSGPCEVLTPDFWDRMSQRIQERLGQKITFNSHDSPAMLPLTIEEQAHQDEVVRAAQREHALEKLEAEILKGINSGYGDTFTPDFWDRMNQRIQERLDQETKDHTQGR